MLARQRLSSSVWLRKKILVTSDTSWFNSLTWQIYSTLFQDKRTNNKKQTAPKFSWLFSSPTSEMHGFWPALDWPKSRLTHRQTQDFINFPALSQSLLSGILSNILEALKIPLILYSIERWNCPRIINNKRILTQSTYKTYISQNPWTISRSKGMNTDSTVMLRELGEGTEIQRGKSTYRICSVEDLQTMVLDVGWGGDDGFGWSGDGSLGRRLAACQSCWTRRIAAAWWPLWRLRVVTAMTNSSSSGCGAGGGLGRRRKPLFSTAQSFLFLPPFSRSLPPCSFALLFLLGSCLLYPKPSSQNPPFDFSCSFLCSVFEPKPPSAFSVFLFQLHPPPVTYFFCFLLFLLCFSAANLFSSIRPLFFP